MQVTSAELLKKAGGATEEQKQQAQDMIARLKLKYLGFNIALDDVLVMHVAHGLSFEHIEQTLSDMV